MADAQSRPAPTLIPTPGSPERPWYQDHPVADMDPVEFEAFVKAVWTQSGIWVEAGFTCMRGASDAQMRDALTRYMEAAERHVRLAALAYRVGWMAVCVLATLATIAAVVYLPGILSAASSVIGGGR